MLVPFPIAFFVATFGADIGYATNGNTGWVMAGVYWVVQFAAAVCGSLLARAFFGAEGNLAATMPKPGQSWQSSAPWSERWSGCPDGQPPIP